VKNKNTMINLRLTLWAAASCLALIAATPAAAETLSEALYTAVETSPRLGSAREQVSAARQALPIAWAEALPQISATASANKIERSETVPATFVREQPKYWVASLTTSTTLFSSGHVFASTREARQQIASAVASYRGAAQDFMLDVIQAYADVLFAQAVKDAQDRALQNFQEQYDYVSSNVVHGFLTKTDLAQAGARVEQARANVAQANAQMVRANETYVALVGHRPENLVAPAPLVGLPGDLPEAIEIAMRENPRLLAAQANTKAAEAARAAAIASGLPRITFETNNSVFEAIDKVNSRQQSEDTMSLRLTIPISNGGATAARSRQQRHLRNAARFDEAGTELNVHEKVTSSWASREASRATLAASNARVEAAELAQHGMLREQQAGLRTTIDVLNQEEELLSARVDLARAKRDLLLTDREVAAAIGRLAKLSFDTPPKSATGARGKTKLKASKKKKIRS
jgi:outer membrane protein